MKVGGEKIKRNISVIAVKWIISSEIMIVDYHHHHLFPSSIGSSLMVRKSYLLQLTSQFKVLTILIVSSLGCVFLILRCGLLLWFLLQECDGKAVWEYYLFGLRFLEQCWAFVWEDECLLCYFDITSKWIFKWKSCGFLYLWLGSVTINVNFITQEELFWIHQLKLFNETETNVVDFSNPSNKIITWPMFFRDLEICRIYFSKLSIRTFFVEF